MATIVLCVTGSIAAYKAADLASKLKQAGHDVTTVMSEAATKLVTPATFQNLTGHRVYVDLWDPVGQTEHIGLTDRADLVVVAPATANCLAKLAHGLGDDIVSTTLLALAQPALVCPAMNHRMWNNPVVQANLQRVVQLGHHVLAPGAGHLACGHTGPGRLAEPAEILVEVERLLAKARPSDESDEPMYAIVGGADPEPQPPLPAAPRDAGLFLELVTYDAPLAGERLERERAYRAGAQKEGWLVSSGVLGEKRRAHVHRARTLDEVLERARRSPAAGSNARIEVFPWKPELGPPPGP